jgi:hypothetical protein
MMGLFQFSAAFYGGCNAQDDHRAENDFLFQFSAAFYGGCNYVSKYSVFHAV